MAFFGSELQFISERMGTMPSWVELTVLSSPQAPHSFPLPAHTKLIRPSTGGIRFPPRSRFLLLLCNIALYLGLCL
jgi:hypothetical protein